MPIREELHVVREVLEGALPPEVATAAMFAALQRFDEGVPRDAPAVLRLCRGPLTEILARRVGPEVQAEVLRRVEQVLLQGDRTGTDVPLEVDIDLDGMEGEPTITLTMPIVWQEPVSVIVVSEQDTFAARLEASLGATRVHASTVRDPSHLQRAMFSEEPLLVLVDGVDPPRTDTTALATAIRNLPDNVLPVVWGVEHRFGEATARVLQAADVRAVELHTSEGIAPLLDLILARYAGD